MDIFRDIEKARTLEYKLGYLTYEEYREEIKRVRKVLGIKQGVIGMREKIKGFFVEIGKAKYFIESEKAKRNKTDAKKLVIYIANDLLVRYGKEFSNEVVENTIEKVFEIMQVATIKYDYENKVKYINGKDFGGTFDYNEIICI